MLRENFLASLGAASAAPLVKLSPKNEVKFFYGCVSYKTGAYYGLLHLKNVRVDTQRRRVLFDEFHYAKNSSSLQPFSDINYFSLRTRITNLHVVLVDTKFHLNPYNLNPYAFTYEKSELFFIHEMDRFCDHDYKKSFRLEEMETAQRYAMNPPPCSKCLGKNV
jgi:hypothetical protein